MRIIFCLGEYGGEIVKRAIEPVNTSKKEKVFILL